MSKFAGTRVSNCLLLLLAAVLQPAAYAQNSLARENTWDRQGAAHYLDARIDLWFERATELKTGEGKTTCISCHTAMPYLLARPVLRKIMQVSEPTPQESRLLKEVALRVATYPEHESMSDRKHGGEQATEAVLNALVLAWQDGVEKRARPSAVTQKAFEQLWETQSADGAWDWMNFGEEPDETADARYNGAALAALAIGTAPSLLKNGDADAYVEKLRRYLADEFAHQNLYRRTWALAVSARLGGLLTAEQREALAREFRARQNADGGWSLYGLGPWRWSTASAPFTPPGKPDLAALEKSDGYATGLVAYALRQSGVAADDTTFTRATDWLKANQSDAPIAQGSGKCWRSYSLNHDREKGGVRGGPWKQLLMSDIATAFAVLALAPPE